MSDNVFLQFSPYGNNTYKHDRCVALILCWNKPVSFECIDRNDFDSLYFSTMFRWLGLCENNIKTITVNYTFLTTIILISCGTEAGHTADSKIEMLLECNNGRKITICIINTSYFKFLYYFQHLHWRKSQIIKNAQIIFTDV